MSAIHPSSDNDRFLGHPAKGGSSAFAILFAVSFCLHAWQSRKYESWAYTWQLPCACIIIIAGFICREYVAFHPSSDQTSAIQGLFYSATPVFTLPLYTFLLRLLTIPPTLVRIRPSYYFSFVSCFTTAIISCTAQGAATHFSSSQPHGAITSGLALVKASLFLQFFLNGAFIYVLAMYQYRQSRRYRSEHSRDRRMMTAVATFYVLIALVIICNIYRTVQIFAGPGSRLWTSEVYFWVFEAVVMLLYTVIFHVMHPAKYISLGYGTGRNTSPGTSVEEANSREE